jgi:drug/metabolite transporter (DMT)-like permease
VKLPAITTRTGAFIALALAVLIYGGNFTANRSALQAGLTPDDMVTLRFFVAGPLLLPVFFALGWKTCAGVGWGRGLVLAVGSGVPMVFLMNFGLTMAPASYGAAVQPGMVTVVATLAGFVVFAIRPTLPVAIGLALAFAGLLFIGLSGANSGGSNAWLGVLCFAVAGSFWGLYVVLSRHWGVEPLAATAVVAVLSFLVWAPYYLGVSVQRLSVLSWGELAFHAFNQGILNTVVALWLFTSAAAVVGPAIAGRFPPMIPVVGLAIAVLAIGEQPSALQITGMILIVVGLLATSVKRQAA